MSVSIWLDVIGLVTAVTFLEAAVTGRGRTISRGHENFWQVAPWLRPVLGIVGLGLLGIVLVNVLGRF